LISTVERCAVGQAGVCTCPRRCSVRGSGSRARMLKGLGYNRRGAGRPSIETPHPELDDVRKFRGPFGGFGGQGPLRPRNMTESNTAGIPVGTRYLAVLPISASNKCCRVHPGDEACDFGVGIDPCIASSSFGRSGRIVKRSVRIGDRGRGHHVAIAAARHPMMSRYWASRASPVLVVVGGDDRIGPPRAGGRGQRFLAGVEPVLTQRRRRTPHRRHRVPAHRTSAGMRRIARDQGDREAITVLAISSASWYGSGSFRLVSTTTVMCRFG
jgi:hypothetical protein